MRQRGEDVFFLTGTDEHGEPVALAAEREGVTPQRAGRPQRRALRGADAAARVVQRLLHPHHRPAAPARVQEVMQRVHDNGHTYMGTYEGWYCPRCADFKTETEIGPRATRCPIHQIPLDREQEENWFFRLSAFQEPLERLYAERPTSSRRAHRYNEALAFIKSGLQRRLALARARSAGACRCRGTRARLLRLVRRAAQLLHGARLRARRRGPHRRASGPPTFHVIGKDILKFHAVFWPAMLMAAELAAARARCSSTATC